MPTHSPKHYSHVQQHRDVLSSTALSQRRRNLRAAQEVLRSLNTSREEAEALIEQFDQIVNTISDTHAGDEQWLMEHRDAAYKQYRMIENLFAAHRGYDTLLQENRTQLGSRYEIPQNASALRITQIIYKELHGEDLRQRGAHRTTVPRYRPRSSSPEGHESGEEHTGGELEAGGESATSAPASGWTAVNHSLGRASHRREQEGSFASPRLSRAEQVYGVNVFAPVSRRTGV